jgi:tetratricopeptide (TPR) repeat protein
VSTLRVIGWMGALALIVPGCSDAPAPPPRNKPVEIASIQTGLSAEAAAQALLAESPSSTVAASEPAGVAESAPAVSWSRQGVFARRPRELPPAAADAWKDLYATKDQLSAIDEAQRKSFAAAGKAFLRREFQEVLERTYALLEARPDFPPALLMLGATYYKLRRYEDSIDAHERFLAHAGSQVGTTQALGHCYYGLGRYEQALAHYERVVEANPTSPEALRGLALSKMRLGDLDGALAGLRRVLQLDPDHAEAQSFMAQVLYDMGEAQGALEAAQRARLLAPADPRPWYLISQCLRELGDDESADQVQAEWKEVAAVAEETRSIEARLAYRPPDSHALALRLVDLHTRMRDVRRLGEALDMVAQLRPPGFSEVEVRILALDAFERCGHRQAAENAAKVLEQTCAGEVDAWKRLEQWYQSIGDPQGQIRAGEMWRRLNAGLNR